MKAAWLLWVLLLGSGTLSSVHAQEAPEEGEEQIVEATSSYSCYAKTLQKVTFKYCLRHVARTNTKDLIYYFHGRGRGEDDWFKGYLSTQMVQHRWHHKGYDPMVIGVSFGPTWALVDSKRYKLMSYFKNVVMPFVEKKVGGLQGGSRKLIGLSMGGFNALQVALREPTLFKRVALLCPAISTIGPYDSDRKVRSYIRRTKALPMLVYQMLRYSRALFVDEEDWRRNDPLRLIKTYDPPVKPKIYLSIGMADSYGFQEGSKKLRKLSREKQIFPLTWVPMPGPHCMFDRKSAADFMMGD